LNYDVLGDRNVVAKVTRRGVPSHPRHEQARGENMVNVIAEVYPPGVGL
jgi:hypothetical protein